MTSNTIWKLIVSAVAIVWAITSLIPMEDTAFEDYIGTQVEAETEAFNALIARAEERAAAEDEQLFVALRNLVTEERYELSKHFPQLNVADSRNLDERNKRILNEISQRAKGNIHLGLDLQGGSAVTLKIGEQDISDDGEKQQEEVFEDKEALLTQAIEVIRQRIDSLGVAETVIRPKGEDSIEVQMPGVDFTKNPEFVDNVIRPAALEFALVHRDISPPQPVPPGFRAMEMEREDDEGNIQIITQYVKRIPEIEGGIKQAYPIPNEAGGYQIGFELTSDASAKFARMTQAVFDEDRNRGVPRGQTSGQIATILDGKLESSFGVLEPITGGRGSITGNFTRYEAIEYVGVLNNPLQFGLEIDEMSVIGPNLAKDAQSASMSAGIYGGIAVLVFMVAVYWVGGIVAAISVLANVVIILGTLSQLGATITLPGVAGLVLTIGMAVDAQILIFERIREELKAGKSLKSAVTNGFDKVFSTIIDANVTTLVTAIILITLGVGAVRGFGVTLTIGIFSSVFCALVFTRGMLDTLLSFGVTKVMPTNFLPTTKAAFLSHWRKAFTGSWIVVAIGVVTVIMFADKIMGIDFVGGDELTINYEETISTTDIIAFAENNDLGEVIPNYQESLSAGGQVLKLQTEIDRGDEVFAALAAEYPMNGLELVGTTQIGASVGQTVTQKAMLSVAIALIGILLYVALRFETGYGIGAVVATVHDMLMTIGLFVVLGDFFGIGSGQFTAPMVAAILMVLGYSINDTIVVFDRIREELELDPKATLRNIINLAINRTLGRTLLTSTTTFLAAICLYLFGAGVITDFALVFIIGILTGTFSSIFIASPVFFWWHKGDRKHVEEQHDILPKYEWEVGGSGPDEGNTQDATPSPAS